MEIAGSAGQAVRPVEARVRRLGLLDEVLVVAGWLRERALWLVLLIGVVLWTLAYQVPYQHRLDVGGNTATRERHFDAPFLSGFHASEPDVRDGPVWWQLTEEPYRWSYPDATLTFPGVGSGDWIVRVRARVPAEGPTVGAWSDSFSTTPVELTSQARTYTLLARADASGDVRLRLVTPQFAAPDDPRPLGMVVHRVDLLPTTALRLPSFTQLGLLVAILALAYGVGRRLGASQRSLLVSGGLATVVPALLLAFARLDFTLFTPLLLPIVAGCYGLALVLVRLPLLDDATERLTTRWTVPVRNAGIIALVLLAFALRMGGLVYPHTRDSDIGMNANNLEWLTKGVFLFSQGLPARTGGGEAPYPPGQYVLFVPAQLLTAHDHATHRLIVSAGNALLDALLVGALWYALRRAGVGRRGALLGAALYLLPSPVLRSFSIGELANISGQVLMMPLLLLLALEARNLGQWRTFGVAVALMALAYLGHMGVAISLTLTLGCLVLVWLFARPPRLPVGALVAAGTVVALLVGLVYYSAFAHLFAERLAGTEAAAVGAAPTTRSVGQKLSDLVAGVARPTNPLSPLMLGLGALGVGALLSRPATATGSARRTLPLLLVAWWGGTLLSLGLLLFADQGVRWDLFIYPALCLGAGPLLALLWARGRAGALVALAALAFLLWRGAALGADQIATYLR